MHHHHYRVTSVVVTGSLGVGEFAKGLFRFFETPMSDKPPRRLRTEDGDNEEWRDPSLGFVSIMMRQEMGMKVRTHCMQNGMRHPQSDDIFLVADTIPVASKIPWMSVRD